MSMAKKSHLKRRRLSSTAEVQVLSMSRRRCAICYGLLGDTGIKDGQIAHLDRNRNNNDIDNLCFLCLNHHNTYDAKMLQAKHLTVDEVKIYRMELYAAIKAGVLRRPSVSRRVGPARVSSRADAEIMMRLFDRRLKLYVGFLKFLSHVTEKADLELSFLYRFSRHITIRCFVFGDDIEEYLQEVKKKAIRLRAIRRMVQHEKDNERLQKLFEEESEVLSWLSDQFDEGQRRFKKYLQIDWKPGAG